MKKKLLAIATVAIGVIGGICAVTQLMSGNPATGMILGAFSFGLCSSVLVALYNKVDAFNPDVLLETVFK